MKRFLHQPGCSCRDLNRRDVVNAIFGAGLIVGGLGTTKAAADPLKLRGAVKIDGQAAADGQIVKTGSTVEVAPGSEAAFAVGDDAFILRPASAETGGGGKVVVEGSGTTVATMRLIEGGLLSVFGKGENRKVIGSTATIGIRGTGFYMESLRRSTYVCYCYGAFEFFANDAPQVREEAHSTHHDGARFMRLEASGPKIVPVTLGIGHSDADLIAAERSVGRDVPFKT